MSEIDMHCRLFSNAAMQLENHVLVMCIALRQFWGFAGTCLQDNSRWSAVALVGRVSLCQDCLQSLVRSLEATQGSQLLVRHSIVGEKKHSRLLGMYQGPLFLILGIVILFEKR